MRKLLILWDWDNTLNDTSAMIFKSLWETAEHYGVAMPTKRDLREVLSQHKGAYWERAYASDTQEAMAYYLNRFSINHLGAQLFPQAKEILTFVHQSKTAQLIISNKRKDLLKDEIEQAGIANLIDGYIGADDTFSKVKPMPNYGAEVIAQIPHNQLMMIGDGTCDMEYAKAIGAIGVYIRPKEEVESFIAPEFRFDTLKEVSVWLKTYLINGENLKSE